MNAPDKSIELSAGLCWARAEECLILAQKVTSQSQRIMLTHIAETWGRVANKLHADDA